MKRKTARPTQEKSPSSFSIFVLCSALVAFTISLVVMCNTVQAQVTLPVTFKWTQPTHYAEMPPIPRIPIPDGGLLRYDIFLATPTDTFFYDHTDAPYLISEMVYDNVELELMLPTSIRVRATSIAGVVGGFGPWSDPFTITPGPPEGPGQPTAIEIFLETP